MRFALALLFATALALPAADRLQFNRVVPGGLTSIRETNIVVTHNGPQTIPGPAAIAQFVASATAGGSTNGLVIGWQYTEAPGILTFSNTTGPTNLGTFFSQGRYTIRVSSTNGAYYNDSVFYVFVTDQGITNFLPTVELTSPPNGSTFTAPVNLLLIADAQDKDGSVTNVTFFDGPTAVGTLTSAPWQLVLTNATPTQYVFTAVAWDNRGATNISSSYSVTVNPGVVSAIPPTVSITVPTNGATFVGPVTFALTASASDSDGSIASVILIDNDVTNATVTVPPYSVSITPAQGPHVVRAIATDNSGLQSQTSASFTITSSPVFPVATLTAPSGGASFTSPADVTMSATATDSDGTITIVRFFANGAQVGTDSSSPYSFTVPGLTVGTYELHVQAVDNDSGTGVSATNTITVLAPPGTPPVVTLTAPTNTQTFVFAQDLVTLSATATDDGAITNVSFYRVSEPTPPAPGDPVTVNDDDATYVGSWTDAPAPNRHLNDEHYSNATGASAELSFTGNRVSWFATKFTNRGNADVYIDGVFQATVDEYDAVVLYQQQLYTTNLTQGVHTIKIVCKGTKNASSTGFYVDIDYFEYASEVPGSPGVETFIVSDTVAPYSQTWAPELGTYLIHAKAWDNLGIISTSAPPVSISVNAPFPPFVQITNPTEGQTFTNGTAIPLAANATDQDGTVVSVNFRQYIPDMDISTDTTSPYTGSWTNAPVGDYAVVAVSTDSDGQVSFSQTVNIHIINATNVVYVDSGPAQTAQLSAYKAYFDAEYVSEAATFNNHAAAGWGQNVYDMNTVIESTTGMYEGTLETNYLNRALLWIETIISKATIIDIHGKKNWRGIWVSPYSSTNIAYLLEDMQAATSMMRATRVVLQDTRLRSIWGTRVTAIYNFVRDHVVNKHWFTRGTSSWFQNKFTNPASVQSDKEIILARLLLDLKICSTLLANTDNSTYGYPALVALAAAGLKDYNGAESRFTPWTFNSLVWSRGKQYEPPHFIMDTAHAQRLAAFVYDFYKAGTVIDQNILQGTCTLFSKVIWNQSTTDPLFVNFIDGSNVQFRDREGYRNGQIYIGWCVLGEMDTNCMAASKAMMKFMSGTGVNLSQSYNDIFWGRTSLAGNLTKAVSFSGLKPYALLNGTVTGGGTTGTNWARLNGPGTVTIVSPNSAVTTILFGTNAVGVSTFRLTITSGGPTVSDDVTVNLLSAPAM